MVNNRTELWTEEGIQLDEFDSDTIALLVGIAFAVIVFVIIWAIIKIRDKKAEAEDQQKILRIYNASSDYIQKNGVTISKEYTYYYEKDLPFARIVIDDVKKRVYAFPVDAMIYTMPYNIIMNCDVNVDSVTRSTGVENAIKGGILAGGAGAIVGALTAKDDVKIRSISLVFELDDLNIPKVVVPLTLFGQGNYDSITKFVNDVKNGIAYIRRHKSLK